MPINRSGLILILVALLSLTVTLVVYGQNNISSSMPKVNCKECHTCDVPTFREPCLKSCPRTEMVHQQSKHQLADAPDSMLLDELIDLYQPVHFNHKVHASMSQMNLDCGTCHHYSPPGQVAPCKDCHSVTAESSDLRKPNLKGAYHRQCLSCHREWSHDTKCVVCHTPKEGGAMETLANDPTDIIGVSHPVITVPMKKVYTTPYSTGPVVTFQHKEHVDVFGFKCVNCHKQENCGNCHDIQNTSPAVKTQEQVHAICNDCHKADQCAKCHDTKERPGFTHNTTGWPLNPYHNKLDCWACHPTGKRISKLSPMCANCHAGWSQENFRHAVVGLQLDEVHSQLDCTDCHVDRKYSEDPKCSDCHDDGRTADKAPPGMKVKSTGDKKR